MTTPRQVWNALTRAGASTTQAIGIMANVINESAFNPEAVGDQGTSFGIVQQHGSQYAGLVTGNPPKDLNAQVRVIAQNGGFKAASGATPGEAAGNFAARYERCQGCQKGGVQYNQRVANAAVVAGWVKSGKWPSSAGALAEGGGGSASAAVAASGSGTGNDCAFGPKLPVVGQVCLVKRATIRHMVGGGLMVGGFVVLLPGLALVLAYGFRASGAARAVGQAASVLPGPAGRVGRAAGAYQVTEREPLGGQMGGTRTVRYRARRRPRREEPE